MSDELKKVADDLKSTWESELKPRIEQMDAEQKAAGAATAETKESIDRVQDRLDELEVTLQKAALAPQYNDDEPSEGRKAYVEYLRKGKKFLEGDSESKTLVIRDESQGGVLAPTDFVAEVIKGIVQYSPIRSIARVKPTSRTSVTFPKRTGNFAAVWTGEVATRSETTGLTFGLEEIPTHELYARVAISNWDLEDPVVDLESEVREDMAEQFGVSEGAAFVAGTGVGKPEGFAAAITGTSSADVSQVLYGAAAFNNTQGADGLINLKFALKEQYWPNATFVLNRLTLRDIRLIKDTTGNFLWAPGLGPGLALTGNIPATILDSPYVIATDMPVAASNALTVAYGDFRKGYIIADRIEIAVLQDPYTAASAGAVVFHARKRTGGQVVLPEALKLLKMA